MVAAEEMRIGQFLKTFGRYSQLDFLMNFSMREREVDNVSESGRMKTPSTDTGKLRKKNRFCAGAGRSSFSSGHGKVQIPLKYLSRDVETTVVYINLKRKSRLEIRIWKYGPKK